MFAKEKNPGVFFQQLLETVKYCNEKKTQGFLDSLIMS